MEFVKVVAQINAQARAEDGGVHQLALLPRCGKEHQHLLHASQGKNGNKDSASAFDRVVDRHQQAFGFVIARGLARIISARGFHDECIHVSLGQAGAGDRPLIVEGSR